MFFHESFLAGAWQAVGGTLGKLSGAGEIVGSSYTIWLLLLALMVVANTIGNRFYVRSLDAANNSLGPTVTSSAASFVISGFVGVVLFEEDYSWKWWLGIVLIIIGLTMVAWPRNKYDHQHSRDSSTKSTHVARTRTNSSS